MFVFLTDRIWHAVSLVIYKKIYLFTSVNLNKNL